MRDTDFLTHTFKNGIRLIHKPTDSPVSHLGIIINAGSRDEESKEHGLAHFIEHSVFKGTKKRPNTMKIVEPLDQIGGHYNAFTSQEYTGYWAKVDAGHLDLALDWVSDIYINSLFDVKEINRERGTILQEINIIRSYQIPKFVLLLFQRFLIFTQLNQLFMQIDGR